MAVSEDNLRFILGLKVKTLRQSRGLSLKQLSSAAHLSISYLSEIEKGKKYPKPEKLIGLAEALGISFDELVSVRVDKSLDPVTQTLRSPLFSEFPFEVFGLEAQDLFSLFSEDPSKAGALVRTFLEIGQMYDMRVEHFLFAALRSYQLMHDNYFEEIEEAAAGFRWQAGVEELDRDPAGALQKTLERVHGYTINSSSLSETPELHDLRSVLADGSNPTLFVNKHLLPSQKAFVFGRELAYHVLGLGERATTSSWLKVTSFEQVLNNFKASYFAGAVLIDRDRFMRAISEFFTAHRWSDTGFAQLIDRFAATPEMFFYRLGQLLPRLLGFQEFFFLKFNYDQLTNETELTKVFNQTDIALPQGFWLDGHYCRRWAGIRLIESLKPGAEGVQVRSQRSRFIGTGQEFFAVSVARPLQLTPSRYSCVTLGFKADENFQEKVSFANDPLIPVEVVNVTCERCPLTASECTDRASEGTLLAQEQRLAQRERAIQELVARAKA